MVYIVTWMITFIMRIVTLFVKFWVDKIVGLYSSYLTA